MGHRSKLKSSKKCIFVESPAAHYGGNGVLGGKACDTVFSAIPMKSALKCSVSDNRNLHTLDDSEENEQGASTAKDTDPRSTLPKSSYSSTICVAHYDGGLLGGILGLKTCPS